MQVSVAERMAACTVDILEDKGIVSSITANFFLVEGEEVEEIDEGERADWIKEWNLGHRNSF
jgi:hypothetical protein